MNPKLKTNLLLFRTAVFVVLFLFSGVMLAIQHADKKQSAEAFDEIAALIQDEAELPESSEESTDGEELPTSETVLTAYDKYAAVYEQNADFVGWISIDGTNINYPVMQMPDNPNFYLKHAFDGSYSNYGTPYVQENCMVGSSDNLILYGHHMNNGSMFADLCKYENEKFYREHSTIHFDTLDGYGDYEIVAVFKTVAYSQDGFKYYIMSQCVVVSSGMSLSIASKASMNPCLLVECIEATKI